MGIWYSAPQLRAGESVIFRAAGNLLENRRQLGGQLTVTDQRFIYAPSRLAARFDATAIAMDLADITALQLAKPGRAAVARRGAGAMRRYQVEITSAGDLHAFTLRNHEGLMKAISESRRP